MELHQPSYASADSPQVKNKLHKANTIRWSKQYLVSTIIDAASSKSLDWWSVLYALA